MKEKDDIPSTNQNMIRFVVHRLAYLCNKQQYNNMGPYPLQRSQSIHVNVQIFIQKKKQTLPFFLVQTLLWVVFVSHIRIYLTLIHVKGYQDIIFVYQIFLNIRKEHIVKRNSTCCFKKKTRYHVISVPNNCKKFSEYKFLRLQIYQKQKKKNFFNWEIITIWVKRRMGPSSLESAYCHTLNTLCQFIYIKMCFLPLGVYQ